MALYTKLNGSHLMSIRIKRYGVNNTKTQQVPT